MPLLDDQLAAFFQPPLQFFHGMLCNGHHTLLVALAMHPYEALIQVEVTEEQLAEFADTQSTTVERLQDGHVTVILAHTGVYGSFHGINLLHAEHLGQVLARLR